MLTRDERDTIGALLGRLERAESTFQDVMFDDVREVVATKLHILAMDLESLSNDLREACEQILNH